MTYVLLIWLVMYAPQPWAGRARVTGLVVYPAALVIALGAACWTGQPPDSRQLGLSAPLLALDVLAVLALTMVPERRHRRPRPDGGQRVLAGHPG